MADSSVTGEMGRSTPEQRTRAGKALRKSTQSCTECRRRKIRCSFPPNNRSLCIPCSSRGSRCIDQRNEHASAAMEDRKTLRDRVARLESLLETALHGKQEGDAMNFQEDGPDAAAESAKSAETDESEDGLDDEATSVPYMSALNDSMGSLDVEGNRQQNLGLFARPMTSSKLPQVHGNINHQQTDTTLASTENGASRKKTKQVRVCEELRSSLPKYDEMMEVCVQRGSWWPYWREKTYGDLKPVETLPQYASRVFINGTIWELGTLVSAFGLTTETKKSYYLAIVEKLLISDDQYAATLPGIECILLQGKCYLDIGQPRKAWLMYRRGLTVAQLSNLHRNHRKSVLADNLFWALYQGERFISILLNLPYSVNDIHCDLGQHPNSNTKGAGVPLRPLIIRCGMLAGKIIDRNQSNMEKSVSRTIEIDDEMQSTAEAMPPGWWDLPSARSDPSEDTAQIRQRLLLQVCFYLMRVHLNLPLLPDTQPNLDAGSGRCRMSCIDSARMLVQRYNILRTVVDGKPLLDDSTNDFIGFTVAVILLIGASRKSSSPHLAAQAEEDWSLVEKTLVIFKNLSRYTPSSKLYKQAYRALDKLMSNQAVDGKDTKVFIPYLGTVHVRPDRRLQKPSGYSPSGPTLSYQSIRAAAIPTPGDMSKASSNSSLSYPNEGTAPEQSNRLDYEAPAMQHGEFSFSDPQYQIGENGLFYDAANFGTFAGGLDPFPWMDENVPMMDIDQDWTWMEQF